MRPRITGSVPPSGLKDGRMGKEIDHRDHETWLIDTAHAVIEKRCAQGDDALSPRERLIHRFWVVDYAMRNAGDLAIAHDLAPRFREDGLSAARALDLARARDAFAMSEGELERRFFDLFEYVVRELRCADHAASSG
ncbi:hypothetical protein [Sphingomonas sp. UYEF23]|uniref:hypothetical protein n=1 Tax=Sphingomonas sp. UYEF23 TaxID=1756408 RepID=UPI003398EC81